MDGRVWRCRLDLFGRTFRNKPRRVVSACALAASATATLSLASFRSKTPSNRSRKGSGPEALLWTDLIVGTCVAGYAIQLLTKDKLLLMGAKVNRLIDAGQLWRLFTPAFLHGNLMHLMVNCYSLQSVGRTMEYLGGSDRFVAAFVTSAVCGNVLSYKMNPHPAVGASGAIFGLMGCLVVFVLRHKEQLGRRGDAQLRSLARVLAMNLALGVLSPGIDNWGHLGGLLGGMAFAYAFGPRYVLEKKDGALVPVDRPPVEWWKDDR